MSRGRLIVDHTCCSIGVPAGRSACNEYVGDNSGIAKCMHVAELVLGERQIGRIERTGTALDAHFAHSRDGRRRLIDDDFALHSCISIK